MKPSKEQCDQMLDRCGFTDHDDSGDNYVLSVEELHQLIELAAAWGAQQSQDGSSNTNCTNCVWAAPWALDDSLTCLSCKDDSNWEPLTTLSTKLNEPIETKKYGDGTHATGTVPLPSYSPKEQEVLYLALDVAQKAWDGKCEYAEIEGLAWNLRNEVRALLKAAGLPLPAKSKEQT